MLDFLRRIFKRKESASSDVKAAWMRVSSFIEEGVNYRGIPMKLFNDCMTVQKYLRRKQ
jgi:hypothetical protein